MQPLNLRFWAGEFYLPFLHGNFLRDPYHVTGQSGFRRKLDDALSKITPEIVEELLMDDNWRGFECGGWFAAIKGWNEFDMTIGRKLVRSANICQLQGLCVALARFGTHYGAACLRGYFNAALRRAGHSLGEPWAIGALCYIDEKLGTHHAEDYLIPLAQHAARIEAEHLQKHTGYWPRVWEEGQRLPARYSACRFSLEQVGAQMRRDEQRLDKASRLSSESPWNETIREFEVVMSRLNALVHQQTTS